MCKLIFCNQNDIILNNTATYTTKRCEAKAE
jgi:hypothetical protein